MRNQFQSRNQSHIHHSASNIYNSYKLIAEFDAEDNNALLASYLWQPEAVGLDVPLMRVAGDAEEYYIVDGNKNVIALKDSSGVDVSTYTYTPFGAVEAPVDGDENPFRFSSEYHDDETSFVYYNYRYYSPSLGRWTKRDPIEEEGGVNLYNIVVDNPVSYADYLGLEIQGPIKLGHYYYFHIYDSNNEYIGTVSSKIVNDRAEQQSLDIAELLARKIDQRASLRALAGIIVQSGECVEISLRVAITGLDELISVIEFVQDPSISAAVSVIPVVPAGVIKKIYKRFNGKKPKYIVNPAHVPGNPGFHRGKTVLPTDAEKVFKNAIPGDEFYPRTWYGINEKGEIYRFSVDNNGEAHFSGIIDKGKLKEYPRGRLKLKK